MTGSVGYTSARDLFEAAREASRDAAVCRRQLDAMGERALSLGSPGAPGATSGTPSHDRMERAVAAMVDREAALRERMEANYAVMDLAHLVLYGTDCDAGLSSLVPAWWCDAIWHHYVNLEPWERVSELLGYDARHCQRQAWAAMDVADGWGLLAAVEGRGGAEG